MPVALLKTRKSRLVLAAVAIVVVVAAVVVALVLQGQRNVLLTTNLVTTSAPKFTSNANAVPGWQKVLDGIGTSPVPVQTYQSNKSGCTLTTTTAFLPAYLAGHGDDYLTKYMLYQNGTQTAALIKDTDPVYVNALNGQRVQFATGSYSTTQGKTQQVTHVATRAVNKTYKNPNTNGQNLGKDAYGLSLNDGVPVLTAVYTCQQGKGSNDEFHTLLGALRIDLK